MRAQQDREEALRLLQQASDLFRANNYARAKEIAESCVDLCRSLGEPWCEAYAVQLLGRIEHESKNLDKAVELYDEALRISRAAGYEGGVAAAEHEKARIAATRGEFRKAERGFRLALKFYATRNDHARQDPANLQAALNQLADLALSALQFPDQFLPALDSDGVPVGTPEGYLWVRAHTILAEVGAAGAFYRRRLIQRAMALRDSDRRLSDYALQEAGRIAWAFEDSFAARVAEIILAHTPVDLASHSAEPGATLAPASPRLPLPFQTPETAAKDINELWAFLNATDAGSWVYRGQTREYPGPLIPSAFRGIITGESDHADSSSELYQHALRRCGASYYGEYNQRFLARNAQAFEDVPAERRQEVLRAYDSVLKSADSWNTEVALREGKVLPWMETARERLRPEELEYLDRYGAAWLPLINSYHRRCLRHALFRLFGYFLGTTLAQQYGLWSEGLDATGNLAVAAFFATHGSAGDFLSVEKDGTGVIYRFPLARTDIRTRKINDYGYYTLPSIIDVEDVLYRFEKQGLGLDEAIRCFECYCGAVHLDRLSDPDLFFVPEGALESSRVRRQRAFIILPDELRKDVEGRAPGQGGIVFPQFRYIEDLAARPGVQKFYFKHGGALPSEAELTREQLWPRADPILAMVVAMITAVYPLAMFAPDIMPVRLELIDSGYGQSEFLELCRELAARHRMVVYDYQAYQAASVGAVPLRI